MLIGVLAATVLHAPADADCAAGNGWLCSIGASRPAASSPARPRPAGGGTGGGAASPENGVQVEPMCAPTGGADHCITLPAEQTARTPTAEVAEMARDAIALPPPRPRTSPSRRTWVGLPTYLWIDGSAWRGRSARVGVDGQTVAITGRPVRVVWDTGEGTLTCRGPGTPYRRGMTGSSCAHVYRRSGAFTVTATLYYEVTWTCTGACDAPGGGFGPLAASGSVPLRVAEIQTAVR
ncbi:PKD domain-containing protein [Spirillospora sp. CA-253888]